MADSLTNEELQAQLDEANKKLEEATKNTNAFKSLREQKLALEQQVAESNKKQEELQKKYEEALKKLKGGVDQTNLPDNSGIVKTQEELELRLNKAEKELQDSKIKEKQKNICDSLGITVKDLEILDKTIQEDKNVSLNDFLNKNGEEVATFYIKKNYIENKASKFFVLRGTNEIHTPQPKINPIIQETYNKLPSDLKKTLTLEEFQNQVLK